MGAYLCGLALAQVPRTEGVVALGVRIRQDGLAALVGHHGEERAALIEQLLHVVGEHDHGLRRNADVSKRVGHLRLLVDDSSGAPGIGRRECRRADRRWRCRLRRVDRS